MLRGGVILGAEVSSEMNPRTLAFMSLFLVTAAGATACGKAGHEAAKDGLAEGEKEPFGRMTIEELEAKMAAAKAGQAKLAIFDNNQHERFDKSHIAGAKWVKFDKIEARDLPADKDTTLVFYCANEH
ncbi:MAG: rhodanese-like domain-containing protein [Minicystis sp.]